MSLEQFSKKLIEDIYLSITDKDPDDVSLFLRCNRDAISHITSSFDFEILHLDIPEEQIVCNGFLINEEEGKLTILLGNVSKDKSRIEELSKGQIAEHFTRGIKFATKVFNNSIFELLDESEEEIISSLRLMSDCRSSVNDIVFHIISNKLYFDEDKAINEHGTIGKFKYTLNVVSLIDFYEFWKNEDHESIPPNISFKNLGHSLTYLKLPIDYQEYDGYMAIVGARVLYELYEAYGTDLLQSNVRFYLKDSKRENKGLLETLEKSGQMFFAYNNGISATAENIEFDETGNYISAVDNFQIVNGGQTTATIHLYGSKGPDYLEKLDQVFLQMKLTIIKQSEGRENYVQKISQYANTQSKVNFSDLDSNDKFNIELERYSREVSIPGTHGEKWYYERKTGDYFTTGLNLGNLSEDEEARFHNEFSKSRLIKKTDLALVLFAWGFIVNKSIDPRPYDSALGAEKNYAKFKFYKDNNEIKVDKNFYCSCISKILLAKEIEELINILDIKQQRNHIVHYTMALISLINNGSINFEYIWKTQTLSHEFRDVIKKLIPIVWQTIRESGEGLNLSTWCRKVDCWNEIKKINFTFSPNIPEIGGHEPESVKEPTSNNYGIESFQDSLSDSGYWFLLSNWAKKNDKLDGRMRGFCYNMGIYISRHYKLTDKQLAYAKKCLQAAINAGFTEVKKIKDDFYLKRIINQDLQRTPTMNVEAVHNFFKLDLNSGETRVITIRSVQTNTDHKVIFKRRNTRGEYRVFLNELLKEVMPTEGDLLIFRKIEKDRFSCEFINHTSSKYQKLAKLLKNDENHLVSEG